MTLVVLRNQLTLIDNSDIKSILIIDGHNFVTTNKIKIAKHGKWLRIPSFHFPKVIILINISDYFFCALRIFSDNNESLHSIIISPNNFPGWSNIDFSIQSKQTNKKIKERECKWQKNGYRKISGARSICKTIIKNK